MYVKLSIPERLKDLRVERHLTLEELAEATGLSKSALGSYEADDYKDISPFSIVTLSEFYGVSTDYLLGNEKDSNDPELEYNYTQRAIARNANRWSKKQKLDLVNALFENNG